MTNLTQMVNEQIEASLGPEGIGDVTSQKKGSGARFNKDKRQYELLSLSIVATSLPDLVKGTPEWHALFCLGHLQVDPTDSEMNGLIMDCISALVKDDPQQWWDYVAQVMEYGSKKYAPWNWAKGMPWSVVIGCAARHAMKIMDEMIDTDSTKVQLYDPESGLPHRAHLICNLMFLRYYMTHYVSGNDLFNRHSLETA